MTIDCNIALNNKFGEYITKGLIDDVVNAFTSRFHYFLYNYTLNNGFSFEISANKEYSSAHELDELFNDRFKNLNITSMIFNCTLHKDGNVDIDIIVYKLIPFGEDNYFYVDNDYDTTKKLHHVIYTNGKYSDCIELFSVDEYDKCLIDMLTCNSFINFHYSVKHTDMDEAFANSIFDEIRNTIIDLNNDQEQQDAIIDEIARFISVNTVNNSDFVNSISIINNL